MRAMLTAAGLPGDPAADALLERSLALQADLRAAQDRLARLEQVCFSSLLMAANQCSSIYAVCDSAASTADIAVAREDSSIHEAHVLMCVSICGRSVWHRHTRWQREQLQGGASYVQP